MEHFHFHIRDGRALIVDRLGGDYPHEASAEEAAQDMARKRAREARLIGKSVQGQVVEVTNSQGLVISRVPIMG